MVYLAEHPALSIDSLLTDRLVDLIDEGFDVAIRVGPMAPSALLAWSRRVRKIAWTELGFAERSPSRGGSGTLPGSPKKIVSPASRCSCRHVLRRASPR